MTDTLRHRGPDEGNIWLDEALGLAIGHRRLSVIDLSPTGSQPMVSDDNRLVLAFNGELYNFVELRKELIDLGYRFHGSSDTEVLLNAYANWGTDCLDRIEGMFAFAMIDIRLQRLILARDRCGQKPLYYISKPNGFAFASEIKALFKSDLVERRLDHQSLAEYLAYGYSIENRTMVAGVQKLKPGELLSVDLSSLAIKTRKFWQIPALDKPVSSPSEAMDHLESLLEGAVRRHLVADVPLGILLSGGIDSSLITALAARVTSGTLKTFTVVFPGQGRFDESQHARDIASHFGTKHTELEVEQAGPDILPKLATQFDDPLADHAIVPMYLLSKRIREEATVALSGDGGDELFGGYPHHRWISQQERLRRFAPAFIRNTMATLAGHWLPPGFRGRNHLIGTANDLFWAASHMNLYFDAWSRQQLLGEAAINMAPEQLKANLIANREPGLDAMLVSDFRTTLPEGYLAKVDKASMLASLEIRAPMLDDSIVDFAWRRIPGSMKVSGKHSKIVPRQLARKLLPESMDLTRKQGFTMPLASWFSGPWGTTLEEILLSSPQSLFSRPFIERLLNLQRSGYANHNRLFSLAMFLLWQDAYGISA